MKISSYASHVAVAFDDSLIIHLGTSPLSFTQDKEKSPFPRDEPLPKTDLSSPLINGSKN
jgi:hypothetical protein